MTFLLPPDIKGLVILRTIDLSKFGFSGLPIKFGTSPEVFSTIFIWCLLNNSTKILSSLISSFASICISFSKPFTSRSSSFCALIIIFLFEIPPLFETKSLTAFQNDLLCDKLALLTF